MLDQGIIEWSRERFGDLWWMEGEKRINSTVEVIKCLIVFSMRYMEFTMNVAKCGVVLMM